jgi:hypothetical protein
MGRSQILDSGASMLSNEGLGDVAKPGLHRGTSLSPMSIGLRLYLTFTDIYLDRRERDQ